MYDLIVKHEQSEVKVCLTLICAFVTLRLSNQYHHVQAKANRHDEIQYHFLSVLLLSDFDFHKLQFLFQMV